MRIAYLECFSGISGDMFLGALLDAGVPPEGLENAVAALDVGARLEISRVNRSGIQATKVDVLVEGERDLPREVYWEQQAYKHQMEHAHRHGQQDPLPIAADDGTPPHQHPPHDHRVAHGRGLKEILQIISRSRISETAKGTAIRIFNALGAAEAKIHHVELESVHFHEVGAVDAMVDIVCAAVGAETLAVDQWIASPLNVGGGTIECAHGRFPVPAPATIELLKGAPVYSSGIEVELVTPTGAAIVSTLVNRFSSFPAMKVNHVAYGAGTRDIVGHANVLRLTAGEADSAASGTWQDTITILEANVDDLNPQIVGYVMERLLEHGALDVFAAPVQMKKNRPGMLLTILCRPEHADQLTYLIFRETTTLGVRRRDQQRQALARTSVAVATRWGDVRLKVARLNGGLSNYAPEYEDCRRIAAQYHVPLKAVIEEAIHEYLARTGSVELKTEDREGKTR